MWKLVCLALVLGLSLPSADADADDGAKDLSCDYCKVYNAVKNNQGNFKDSVQKFVALSPISLSLDLNVGLVRVNLKNLAFNDFYVSLHSNAQGAIVIRTYFYGNLSLDVDVPLLDDVVGVAGVRGLGDLVPSTETVTVDGYLTLSIDIKVTVTSSGQLEYTRGDALIQGSGELDINVLQQVNVKLKGAIFFPVAAEINKKITEMHGWVEQFFKNFISFGIELGGLNEIYPASST
ncbi:uncharacterized protein LOC142466617 [Ascaphus truei]|uniref:uncharacterized protein LOC142466617 n=1 Tax=Ascaphus truei TaxID=8439 RepID=UPI003F5A6003